MMVGVYWSGAQQFIFMLLRILITDLDCPTNLRARSPGALVTKLSWRVGSNEVMAGRLTSRIKRESGCPLGLAAMQARAGCACSSANLTLLPARQPCRCNRRKE